MDRLPPRTAFWHPFADMGAVEHEQLVIDRAQDVWVWDEQGNRYLDATAGLWYANLGHGRPEIAEAVARQLERLDAYHTFGDLANAPALELCDRLSALMPTPRARVFLGSGGGDVVDTAAKIARAHFAQTGQPQRTHLISRRHGYHGTHGIGTSIGGIEPNVTGWGRLLPDTSVVAHDDPAALEHELERLGPQNVAAFFCEPVIGAGGVHLPPGEYLEATAEICARHGVLFVADCVISAFGRLGTWLGVDRWPIEPDLVTLAKGVTGGTLPLGALLVAEHVAAPFFPGRPGAPILRHGPTYAGHPACCAAALTALDLYERDGLIERGRTLEGPLAETLTPLEGDPLIAEVRAGIGLIGAAELRGDVLAAAPDAVARWARACRAEGVLARQLGRGLAVSPPLTIGEEEIASLGPALQRGLDAVAAELPPLQAR